MRTTTRPGLHLLDLFARRGLAPVLLLAGLAACADPPSADDSNSNGSESASGDGDGDGDTGDESPVIICEPGETKCLDPATLEVCHPTGLSWEPTPCAAKEQCEGNFTDPEGNQGAACVGPCDRLSDSPSSEGCSFYTTSMYQALQPPPEPEDGIVVGNPSETDDAMVELRWVPEGSNLEEIYEGPILIGPGKSYVFHLDPALTIYKADLEKTSLFRSGSVYHVVSDVPVVAYLHAPLEGHNTNGSTLLLPENVLANDYVVYGHGAWLPPNYFIVIAMHNQTTVTWRPTFQTAGDSLPLPFLNVGETGSQLMNRFDNMRIDTSTMGTEAEPIPPFCERDLSGTIIEADKPIWVVSAMLAARLPWCGTAGNQGDPTAGCVTIMDNDNCARGSDFAMEQNLPLDYWGREYVGPHSPLRGIEQHHWRIYAGEDDVTVTVTPAQPGTPFEFTERGQWADLVVPNGTHLEFDGDGVFMPVQYVTGHYDTVPPNPDVMGGESQGIGSPAMVQMVPTAQFLDRYVIVTGINYEEHYVQSIRPVGGAEVLLDGVAIATWDTVGEWEIATTLIEQGEHELSSAESFGIVQYGYSPYIDGYYSSSGYAYMGGMKAEVIYIP
jgi:hypothetical protein